MKNFNLVHAYFSEEALSLYNQQYEVYKPTDVILSGLILYENDKEFVLMQNRPIWTVEAHEKRRYRIEIISTMSIEETDNKLNLIFT